MNDITEVRYATRINHPSEVKDALYKSQKLLKDNFNYVEIIKDELEIMVTDHDMFRSFYLVFSSLVDTESLYQNNYGKAYLNDDTGVPYLIVLNSDSDKLGNWYNTGYKVPESTTEVISILNDSHEDTCENDELVKYINGIIQDEEVDADKVSDRYHTFDELYEDRTKLFALILNNYPRVAWKCRRHANPNDKMPKGMFIAGINTPQGQFTYHQNLKYWDLFKVPELITAPTYDGHTRKDISRLFSIQDDCR